LQYAASVSYIYVVLTAAAGAETDSCVWAHCASEVL
jgi:hypothetical protein